MSAATTAPSERRPRTMSAETAHFTLRTLEVGDATDSVCNWLMDARSQANLNALPRRFSIDELRAYVASFDRVTSHIVGIFEKEGGRLVGIRAAYIDRERSEAILNILIGEADARSKGAQHESRYAMHNFVFEDLDIQSLCSTVVATNTYMLDLLARTGWVCERKSAKQRASGDGTVELHHFRLTREAWRSTYAALALAKASAST